MSDLESTPKKKRLEYSLLTLAVIGSLFAVILYGNLFHRVLGFFSVPESAIYGAWTETNVAPYAAQRIEIQKKAIIVDGRLVATQFEFDGKRLVYQTGGQTFVYLMLNDNHSEMQRQGDKHYQPTFQLTEKYKKNLR